MVIKYDYNKLLKLYYIVKLSYKTNCFIAKSKILT